MEHGRGARSRAATAGAALWGVVAVAGLAIVVHGLTQLRDAHYYRQRTGEGLGFVQAGFELVGGGLVALVAAGGLAALARRFDEEWRTTLTWLAWAVAAAVALGVVAFVVLASVSRRGCIGPC